MKFEPQFDNDVLWQEIACVFLAEQTIIELLIWKLHREYGFREIDLDFLVMRNWEFNRTFWWEKMWNLDMTVLALINTNLV